MRPPCPVCGNSIDRMQRSRGVVCAYPCTDWLTPAEAQEIADRFNGESRRSKP